jgi:histidinol dehydrogenase
MQSFQFRRLRPEEVQSRSGTALDEPTLAEAAAIVRDVRARGEAAVREHAERLGDLRPGEKMWYTPEDLQDAAMSLPDETRVLLERTAQQIARFADAQRRCLTELTTTIPGGEAGHHIRPVPSAGCYAPGGRFPLPSSVLMTAVTARAACVPRVIVASPRPTAVTLAAADAACADGLLAVGGAQAIAALAYGAGPVEACDVVVGPGNRWVTAAKQIVAGTVAIDMLAGPSELVVIADGNADPAVVAADLLAQAEHDPDALPVIITVDEALLPRVEAEVAAQLVDLPTAATAAPALAHGFAVVAASVDDAVAICNRLAPEHVAVHVRQPAKWTQKLSRYGARFEGVGSAEVFGDYGIGPNHVLPTGGTARACGGLSVFSFLRVRTWLRVTGGPGVDNMIRDTAAFARLEGLEGHARSAERRFRNSP